MTTQNLSRRNRIIIYVISIMIVLSMIISAVVSFTPTDVNARPTATAVR